MRDASDAEDIKKVEEHLAGDARAFEFLFDKYREKVYRIAFRFVRNKEDALEVAQEVFIRVFSNLVKFKTDSKFFTWLYRITVNRAIDATRQRKARPQQEIDPELLEAHAAKDARRGGSAPDPSKLAEERDLEESLAAAVEHLSEKHRAVFLLHAMENLSYKEIANVLDCSVGTVMSRLFYARKKLQELLARRGVEPPGRGRPRVTELEGEDGERNPAAENPGAVNP